MTHCTVGRCPRWGFKSCYRSKIEGEKNYMIYKERPDWGILYQGWGAHKDNMEQLNPRGHSKKNKKAKQILALKRGKKIITKHQSRYNSYYMCRRKKIMSETSFLRDDADRWDETLSRKSQI